jgi:hypothetical protein
VAIGQLETHNHSRTGPERLLRIDEKTAGADVRQVLPYTAWPAAGIGKFVFDLRSDRSALKPAAFNLHRTLHFTPFPPYAGRPETALALDNL